MRKLHIRKVGKLNNKGVTLVELLVCITMLSIVVASFYSCFVIAAKTNAKSRVNHKATTLAENTMENIKAEDMDSLMKQIQYPEYSVTDEAGNVTDVQNFRLVNDSTYDYVINMDKLGSEKYAISTDNGITATYNDTLSSYDFYMRNVKMEETAFDVLVEVSPSAAVDVSGSQIGEKDMVHIPSMDANYDAVISDTLVYDEEALSFFESKRVYDPDKTDDENPTIHRTITVKLEMNAVYTVSKVKAAYQYECGGETYLASSVVFTKERAEDNSLRNIFLFFNPHFSWVFGDGNWTEDIVIENFGDYPVDVYLIKQKPAIGDTELDKEKSESYTVNVKVNEGNIDGQGNVSAVSIKTNLGFSFTEPTKEIASRPQAVYQFNHTTYALHSDAVTFFNITPLTSVEETRLLFDVTVKIYEADEDAVMSAAYFDGKTPLAELGGTLRN